MAPLKSETPKIAKIMKKNKASPRIPPIWLTELSNVPISSFILGIVVRLLRGLNSLKVLSPLMFYIDGSSLSELLSAPLSRWGELLDSEDQCAAACLVRYALDCGLQHLQVQRSLATLSLGEARRIELLSWISQARTGQTLVFDEPGIGAGESRHQPRACERRNQPGLVGLQIAQQPFQAI